MATIRKRGARWQVQVRRQGCPLLTKSFALKSDAEAWGRQKEVELDRGEVILVQHGLQKKTLGDLLSRYKTEVTPLKRGAGPEAARLAAMLRHPMADVPLSLIKPALIASYRDERLKSVSSPTVRREMTILRHCFEVARKDWGIGLQANPVGAISKPENGRSRTRRIDADEMTSLDQALRQCRNPVVWDVFQFALATGMRRGEVLSLTWSNVDLDERTAHLSMTKNGESRTVPLSPKALTTLLKLSLRGQKAGGSLGQAIPNEPQQVFPISANAFRLAWERMKKRAGILDLRFHDLRHEAISRFFEIGLSVPEVALISGHRDPRMLFRYTHLKAGDVAKKLEKLREIASG